MGICLLFDASARAGATVFRVCRGGGHAAAQLSLFRKDAAAAARANPDVLRAGGCRADPIHVLKIVGRTGRAVYRENEENAEGFS
jgi:hypothetical protein